MKNWKTTAAGVVSGVMNLWATGGFDGTNWKAWLASTAIVAVGLLAKDAGVTGTGM